MPLTAIDPGSVRQQSTDRKKGALSGVGFSDYMGAATAPAAATVGVTQGYQPSAITAAAMTGVAGTPGSFSGSNTPYFTGNGGSTVTSAGVPYAGGYGAGGTGITPVGSLPGTPSNDFLEKQALFQKMNDANWEMLVAQITVNDIGRDYQARSNILKTKSDTELNAVRNMRA